MAYQLSLSDGSRWQIRDRGRVSAWIDEFASVMNLKGSVSETAETELIFWFRSEFPSDEIRGDTSHGYGWHSLSYQGVRFWFHDTIPEVRCEVDSDHKNGIRYGIMSAFRYPFCHQSLWKGGLPLHTALIERNGQAILLAGSGGTGKSTACRRVPDSWTPLCDDETLVVLDKHKTYRAHPLPTWSEYTRKRSKPSWNVQYSVPLRAIFVLEQSETDGVRPIGKGEAGILINQSTTQSCGVFWKKMPPERQREIRNIAFRNACDMAASVPAFRLRISLHGRFWEEIEKAMGW